MRLRALLAISLVLFLSFGAAGDARSKWRGCPGIVALSYGDTASHIRALNLSCREARRVMKAPARRLGYRCTNPFDHPHGSGGWITCQRKNRKVTFLYSQS